MGDKSKIEWTDATFNPWIGCTKVSPGCKFCYAERDNSWRNWNPAGWGPQAARKRTSVANWRKPLQWNAEAEKAGERRRVFCASLADVFDDHPSILPEWRADLFRLIEQTPSLDWLLLTKRPENILRMVGEYAPDVEAWFRRNPNAWIGTSVEDQPNADKRIPELLTIPAAVRFLSAEPLLGSIDLYEHLGDYCRCGHHMEPHQGLTMSSSDGCMICDCPTFIPVALDWVIVGGESGKNARPMHPDWSRNLRDQCRAAGVPFFFKQWGEWQPANAENVLFSKPNHSDGRNYARLTFPGFAEQWMAKVGKKNAGRLLDGVEWSEFPAA